MTLGGGPAHPGPQRANGACKALVPGMAPTPHPNDATPTLSSPDRNHHAPPEAKPNSDASPPILRPAPTDDPTHKRLLESAARTICDVPLPGSVSIRWRALMSR